MLGNEPDYNLINKAINFSSINKVQKAEEKGGNVNPDAKNLREASYPVEKLVNGKTITVMKILLIGKIDLRIRV